MMPIFLLSRAKSKCDKKQKITAVLQHTYCTNACAIKAEVVANSIERESGLRACSTVGHTFGHAIESRSRVTAMASREAVATGIVSCLVK